MTSCVWRTIVRSANATTTIFASGDRRWRGRLRRAKGTGIMRAVRYHGNRDVRVDDIPEPECRPGFVKIAPDGAASAAATSTSTSSAPRRSPRPVHPTRSPANRCPSCSGMSTPALWSRLAKVSTVSRSATPSRSNRSSATTPVRLLGGALQPVPTARLLRDQRVRRRARRALGRAGYMVHVLPDNVPTDAAALIELLAVGWQVAEDGRPHATATP